MSVAGRCIQIMLTEEELKLLDYAAKKRGKSAGGMIRSLLEKYLEQRRQILLSEMAAEERKVNHIASRSEVV